jgi:ribosome-binding protein aMBF1 (putative translation factor)
MEDQLYKKLDEVLSKDPSGWMEAAQYRADHSAWLQKSQAVALQILSSLREQGLSQKELAARLKVSPQQINKLVKGQENLTLETIAKLSEALQVDLFAVLAGK